MMSLSSMPPVARLTSSLKAAALSFSTVLAAVPPATCREDIAHSHTTTRPKACNLQQKDVSKKMCEPDIFLLRG
jgi:hypothetical protein